MVVYPHLRKLRAAKNKTPTELEFFPDCQGNYSFIHIPKTGGSYVTHILKHYFGGIYNHEYYPLWGRSHSIPKQYDEYKAIIGLIRDPITFYVSVFNLTVKDGNPWMIPDHSDSAAHASKVRRGRSGGTESIKELLNEMGVRLGTRGWSAPSQDEEISYFREFMRRLNTLDVGKVSALPRGDWHGNIIELTQHVDLDVGLYTRFFIMQYLGNNYEMFKNGETHLTHLLRMEHVDDDIQEVMKDLGFDTELFVADVGNEELKTKHNTNPHRSIPYEDYYTDELLEQIRHKDRYIFDLYDQNKRILR